MCVVCFSMGLLIKKRTSILHSCGTRLRAAEMVVISGAVASEINVPIEMIRQMLTSAHPAIVAKCRKLL